jgi:hypothetical protein
VLGAGWRDEDWLDTEAQAQPAKRDMRQIPRRRSPAEELAGIVELDLLGPAQALPAAAGAIEGVAADEDVAAFALDFQIDRSDQVELMQLVGDLGGRSRVGLRGDETGQPQARHRQPVARQNAFDGPFARQRPASRV